MVMRDKARPARVLPTLSRTIRLAASLLLGVLLAQAYPAVAQDSTRQAGLVVQFPEGEPFTACVDLGPDGEATGEEVLRAAGFSTIIDYSSGYGGGTVCKIADQGCDFPAEACFCQCTMKPGDPCIYWTYFHLVDGQWRYANIGASGYTVRAGDVEGWVWGPGGTASGVMPPAVTFEQLCGAAATAPTATIAGEPTAVVSATPLTTATPDPTTTQETAPPTVAVSVMEPATTAPGSGSLSVAPTATVTPVRAMASAEDEAETSQAIENAPPPATEGGTSAGNTTSYILFGVLLAALLGGLVVMKRRGQA
jgi:hypothetical protein